MVDSDKDQVPTGPIPGAQQAGWFLRFWSTLTADKSLQLILCLILSYFVWQNAEITKSREIRADDLVNQVRADKAVSDEAQRQEKKDLVKMILTHCAEREKERDAEQTKMRLVLADLAKRVKPLDN